MTAAIYEEDLLEIARNALGGTLHQEHTGEWAPADVLVDNSSDGQKVSDIVNELKEKSLETSVLGTMRDLYEAHKHDVSFGTLGNFTFIQMIEQLGKLLPEKNKEKTEAEVAKIAEGTVNVAVKIPEQDLPSVSSNIDQLVESYDLSDNEGNEAKHGNKHVDNPLDAFLPETDKSNSISEKPSKERLGSTSHTDVIKRLHPKRSTEVRETIVRKLSSSSNGGKRRLSEEKLSGVPKTQTDYFRQLEARMQQVFQKNDALKQTAGLPPYPNTVDADRIRPLDKQK